MVMGAAIIRQNVKNETGLGDTGLLSGHAYVKKIFFWSNFSGSFTNMHSQWNSFSSIT